MEKKQIDWSSIGFGYIPTEKRYVSNYKDGKWDDGCLTEDANIVLNECAGVLQYSQSVFEGMKAYTTEDGRIVVFRPEKRNSRHLRGLAAEAETRGQYRPDGADQRHRQRVHPCGKAGSGGCTFPAV